MKLACFKSIVTAAVVFGTFQAATSTCRAGEDSCCDEGCNDWSNCCVCRWCDCCCTTCDKVCQFRLVDGCTKCAWSRTWHGPNALATPLREYYIPRPPQCCWHNGCAACKGYANGAAFEVPGDRICESRMNVARTEVSPEAAVGFSPAQTERLGKVRNELDVVAPFGGPATGRAAPAAR
jgi:hypothetical protein